MAKCPMLAAGWLKKASAAADKDSSATAPPPTDAKRSSLVISLKRYLDSAPGRGPAADVAGSQSESFSALLSAHRALLADIGECAESICPDLAATLKASLTRIDESLTAQPAAQTLDGIRTTVRELLRDWGRKTARHFLDKAGEVRD